MNFMVREALSVVTADTVLVAAEFDTLLLWGNTDFLALLCRESVNENYSSW